MADPLYAFVFAGLFSPGPNIILLTASGAQFGFRATLPHVLGVAAGVGVTAGLTGLGLGALILSNPAIVPVLKAGAVVWILWMAWALAARARAPTEPGSERPFTFVQAVLFQWINPKIWAIALAASAGFPGNLPPLDEGLRMASAFSGINLFVCLFWTWAGTLLALLLTSTRSWAVFRLVMALLLAGSAAMVLV